MKIKTWVQITIFISIVIAIGVSIAIFFQQNQIYKTIEKVRLASEIVKVVNQRENIANAYVNYHEKEAIAQWQVMYDVSVRLLQSQSFNTPEEEIILEDMREENVSTNQIFTELMVLNQKQSGKNTQEIEQKLKIELFEKGSSISIGAYRLVEINQINSMASLKKTNTYIMVSIGILIILIFFILLLLRNKILSGLIDLNKGIKIIAAGDLNYKIVTHHEDEIGEITHSFNEMVNKLKERTTEQALINEKLEQSNKELQQFTYITSHDLQEPLRMIASYLQLLSQRYEGKLDSNADDFINFAVNGAKRLQNLIQDLHFFSSMQMQEVSFSPTDLENILKHVEKNLHMMITENKAIITHDPLPVIHAVSSHMTVLLQNLLSNAIKFHAKETPVVHISAVRHEKEWLFSIRDNGIGIDPKKKDQLFKIFKRLVGKEYPGTGIGLAVCKRIIDQHHGRIWIESELGKGTTVYFTIPAA